MKIATGILVLLLTISLPGSSLAKGGREQEGVHNIRSRRSLMKKKNKRLTVPASPPLPGVTTVLGQRAKVLLAQNTDYPPYTSLAPDLTISGFGPDFARALESICKLEVVLVQSAWSDCWTGGKIGEGLLNGNYHGCTTYTHTKGVRNRYLEFTDPILAMNKAAGILTRLENGSPVVDGSSSLEGVKVGDVEGWAPTSDVLGTSINLCTGETFSFDHELVANNPDSGTENDTALKQLLDGEVDALWIYADQAYNYKSACDADSNQEWDCSLWSQFGTSFAYVQTGIYDYMDAGTTLAISKKGSGLANTLNPCISLFIETEEYKDLCFEYGLEASCFQNEFFPPSNDEEMDYSKPTSELTTSCSDGYCPCP